VQPERQADGQIVYSASNPDEGAFIYAAAHFGHRFLRREGKDVEGTEDAEEVTFQILHSFAFTSDRKRSSVIVRRRRTRSEGSAEGGGSAERSGGGGGGEGVVLYCKGADNVILERLDKEKNSRELVDKIKANIAEFTQDGLRTLMAAKVEISEKRYKRWLKVFREAEASVQDREAKVGA
ncbi:unnamed protein product, partial [Sphacelaria rigidula]